MSNLEQLITFNDELASLARAGIPIELGLSQLSRDPVVANDQINAAVSESVEDGALLADAVSEDSSLPPIYQSVVSAGLRCGHLPAALDTLSRYTQSISDLGQSLRAALVYPLVICGLTYLLFVGTCWFVPADSFQQLAGTDSIGGAVFDVLQLLRDSLAYWVAIPPLLLIAMFIGFRSRDISSVFAWLPGIAAVKADQHYASFSELLALLIRHDVPLHEGLELAARACGENKFVSAAQRLASEMESGHSPSPESQSAQAFPPFLRWALTSQITNDLSGALKLAAETYRNRAERRATWLFSVIPTVTCVVLAGGITLLYCLSIFMPFIQLMKDMS